LDALLELSSEHDLHILVPMVTLPLDITAVQEALNQAAARAKTSSIPILGAMVETPAAALTASEILQHADFLSFGTNDLTQYSFAADRENAAVDAYFDDTHDVIFRLISMMHDEVPDASYRSAESWLVGPKLHQDWLYPASRSLALRRPAFQQSRRPCATAAEHHTLRIKGTIF
jgi:hypothetical protein